MHRFLKLIVFLVPLMSLGIAPNVLAVNSGGTLVVATTNDTPDLDIQKYINSSQHNALLPLFNGLVEKDWTADEQFHPIVPGLATSWTSSDDGKVYTFILRKGVKFHDGTPWNAEAAHFNFRRMTDRNFKYFDEQVGSTATGVLNMLKGSRAVDEHTFVVELDRPNRGFIEAIASLPNYYMHSPAAFEKYGNEGIGQNPVGTGPFKLIEFVKGQRTVMARNDDYWGKKPYVDRMVYRPIIEASARAAALKAGEVHIAWDLPVDQVEHLQNDARFNVYLRGLPATKVVECWQASGPFSDIRVRKGVNMAIDRQTLADVILRGTAVPATQMYGMGSASFEPNLPVFEKYDPDGAKKLLAEAGYDESNPLEFYVETSPENDPIAGALQAHEFVQANLAAIGVKMKIVIMDNASWGARYMSPKEDTECVSFDRGYDTDYILDMGYYGGQCVPNGLNNQCYKNAEVDRLMEAAYTAATTEEWTDLHRQAQRIMIADSASIPYVHGLRPMASSIKVNNWLPARAWLQFPGYAWLSK